MRQGARRAALVAAAAVAACAAASPPVTVFPGLSQVSTVAVANRSSSTIAFLGVVADVPGCEALCVALSPARCWSFSWHDASSGPLAQQCFGVTEARWCPAPVAGATSGRVLWPCRGDDDCSRNGRCGADGACACRRAWGGPTCATLQLQPATRGAGLQQVDDGQPTSSWGGSVVPCGGGASDWCMVASEITNHCGIAAWGQNSRVVLARSPTAGGAFVRTAVLWPVFAHEPTLVRSPAGEYVVFYTAQASAPSCTCVNGSTPAGACKAAAAPGGGLGNQSPSWMSYSNASAAGPWSAPVRLWPTYKGADTNFAPLLLANGSMLGLWRKWTGRGSRVFLATGSDWRDPSTYIQHERELFPDLGAAGTEDPFVYADAAGVYHAVFHHMYGVDTETSWWLLACGGHAFSLDGSSWTYTGLAWGDSTTQGFDARFSDGGSYRYTRLERPSIVLGADGDPAFLVSAAQYGTSQSATRADGGDAAYTLIQPVAS